jgi:peptidoglycan/LPS O-acetylase OafA/YrhL
MKNRLDYLDSIRGLAALCVVIGHFLDMYVKHNYSGIQFSYIEGVVEPFELGRVGVVIFFIISGFVVPYSFNDKEGKGVISKFAIKSAFRLYPAFWLSILIAIVIGAGIGINILSTEQVILNFTMLPKYLGVESVQGAYWTLHLLFVFYVLCCALFFLGKLNNNKVLTFMLVSFCLLAVAFAFLRYAYAIRIPIVMPLGLATMFLGALLRNHYSDNSISNKHVVIILGVYFITMLLAQNLYYLSGWPRWFSAYAVAISVFLFFTYKVNFKHEFLSYIGRISYSMYLLHMLVLAFVFNTFSLFSYQLLGGIFSFVLTLILSVLLADISYRIFEMKSAALCRSFMSNRVVSSE